MKIGVLADSFRGSFRENIQKSAQAGAQGVQLYATQGELAPENLSPAKRKELLAIIKDAGLEVAAICGDLGGHGFMIPEDNPNRIERSKRIMDLALDWETKVITTHIGVVPPNETYPAWNVLRDACEQLGRYGDEVGAYFAIETGPERAAHLRRFLWGLDSKGVRVNFDPANLVMVSEDDPIMGVAALRDYIVHTHAKDGVSLAHMDPNEVYKALAEGGIEAELLGKSFEERPLGQGDVNVPAWVAALKSVGYDGYLTIEREVGPNPEADIRMAVAYLRNLI